MRSVDHEPGVRTHQDVRLRISRRGRTRATAAIAGRALRAAGGHPRSRAPARWCAAGRRGPRPLFVVHAGGRAPDPEVADLLREHDLVEFAYAKPPVALPVRSRPVGADRPPGRSRRRPATISAPARAISDDPPAGIGAAAAWKRPGGDGTGVRIIDVEADWRFTHEDLSRTRRPAGGRPEGDLEWRNHGTNVLGMLRGEHDGRGVTASAPAPRYGRVPTGRGAGARPRRSARPRTRCGPATSCCWR